MAGIPGIYIYNEQGELIGATGGKLAAMKNKANNPNFYSEIGKSGGSVTGHKGFAVMAEKNPELHRQVAMKGGTVSRKPKNDL